MKSLIKPLLFFLLGFGLMMIFQLLTQCNKEDDFLKNSINSDEIKNQVDYKAIDKAVGQYQDAFADADQESIDALTWEETLEQRAVNNLQYSTEELEEIGKAMRKAKPVSATANFAELEYTIDGVTFTFTMGLDDDGIWKLVRY